MLDNNTGLMSMNVESGRHIPGYSRLVSAPMGVDLSAPALFLDRDGVIVEDVHYLKRAEQVRILPGVAQALRMLQESYLLIVVTNQSGIARGYFTEEDLVQIHRELVQQLWVESVIIDALYYCPHLPDAPSAAYRQNCDCRKPKPGMLLRASQDWRIDLERSIVIGDSQRDMDAGLAARMRGILLKDGEAGWLGLTGQAPDLLRAADLIRDMA